jgi:Transposase DDE domain group 1
LNLPLLANRQQCYGMIEDPTLLLSHLAGEQPLVEHLCDQPIPVDTYAGRVHVEWDPDAPITPLGQMAFFIAFLKTSGLFDSLVAACPLHYSSPNAPSKRAVLGTALLSVLSGHRRYAHITALRADTVNPPLLGMSCVLSEDAIRRAFEKIEADAGVEWLQEQLDYTTRPLLGEAWILDADTTVKPLYGEQEGAVVGYNPAQPGRPSHTYHSFMIGPLRLMLEVEVRPGDQHAPKHGAPDLWALLDRLGPGRQPWLRRGDNAWAGEAPMREAEQRHQPYLFRLRLTRNVGRAIERAMTVDGWQPAGQGWEGQAVQLRLVGWSCHRRVVLLRRKLDRPVAIKDCDAAGQHRLSFASVEPRRTVWEFAALVTSLDSEILSLGQLYRDRGDAENDFDELKNQWGWGGFTTQDLKRCRLMARFVALVFNWWTLFVRLADPDRHREAITSRPLLLTAIGRRATHAGQTTIRVRSTHGRHAWVRGALTRIGAFLEALRSSAEQLTPLQRWYRILSAAFVRYLKGRPLDPPRLLGAT